MVSEATLARRILELCRDSGATICQSIGALNLAVTLMPVLFEPVKSTAPPADDREATAIWDEIERLKVQSVQSKH